MSAHDNPPPPTFEEWLALEDAWKKKAIFSTGAEAGRKPRGQAAMNELEQLPKGEIFSLTLTVTRRQMEQAKDFERFVDHLLRHAKAEIMKTYRDQCQPPPFVLPSGEEER